VYRVEVTKATKEVDEGHLKKDVPYGKNSRTPGGRLPLGNFTVDYRWQARQARGGKGGEGKPTTVYERP